MVVLAWNILHGGGPSRLPEIALSLAEQRPDICVLTEFRAARGGQLRAVLADHGLGHQTATHGPGRLNGVLLASRQPLMEVTMDAGRWIDAAIPAADLRITAVHVPDDTQPGLKAACWQRLVAFGRERRGSRHIIIGDVNTGRRGQDALSGAFACEAMLGTLMSLGYVDAWRSLHPESRDATWVAPWGEGRRIDAAYISPPLATALREAQHIHDAREQGISDHAAVRVVLADAPPLAPERSKSR
ncbi:MAG: hypothetical protein JSR77_05095 [Planctomycetes bacterium]|nr:hypothetical protein [Planctomycetota bacterium]